MRSSPRWQSLATLALVALGIAAAVLAFVQTMQAGANWDLRIELENFAAIRGLDPAIAMLDDAYEAVPSILATYGVLFWALANGIYVTLGGDGALTILDPASLVWFGGLGVALSLATAVVLAVVVGVVLRSRWSGAFAGALLLATPAWLGHSAMNFKDVTFAEGLTLVVLGLISVTITKQTWPLGAASAAIAAVGATLALGVRGSSSPLILVVLVGSAVLLSVKLWVEDGKSRLPMLWASTALAAVVALAVTWLTNPFARISLAGWLVDAFELSRQFPNQMSVRVAGIDVMSDNVPWWYLPAWLAAQLPLATIIANSIGAVGFVVTIVSRRTRWQVFTFTPFFIPGILFPLAMVASGAVLYDAARHVLFMLPFLVVLAAVGVWWLDGLLRRNINVSTSWLRTAAMPIVSVVVVAASLTASIRWAPYSYAHLNVIAAAGDGRDWELDYWGLSVREGAGRLRALGEENIYVLPNSDSGVTFGTLYGNAIADLPPGARFGLYDFLRWDPQIPDGCEEAFTIERGGQTLGVGYRCVSQ